LDYLYQKFLFEKDILWITSEIETHKSLIVFNFKKIVWKHFYLIDLM